MLPHAEQQESSVRIAKLFRSRKGIPNTFRFSLLGASFFCAEEMPGEQKMGDISPASWKMWEFLGNDGMFFGSKSLGLKTVDFAMLSLLLLPSGTRCLPLSFFFTPLGRGKREKNEIAAIMWPWHPRRRIKSMLVARKKEKGYYLCKSSLFRSKNEPFMIETIQKMSVIFAV